MKNNYHLLISFLLPFFLPSIGEAQVENSQPNIVFFFVDDMGIKDLSCYGSDFHQTPNIDKLSASGTRFTNAYAACTVCSPSRAALMTGQYPARLQITDWIDGWFMPYASMKIPEWQLFLPSESVTLPEMLKEKGYKTIHVGKWHLGENEKDWPLSHGFDVNIGGWKAGSPATNKGSYFSPYNNPTLPDGEEGEYLTDRLVGDAIHQIEIVKGQPFYLQFNFYNVHTPLEAKPEKVAKYQALIDKGKGGKHHQNPVYAAMVEHVDDAVGKILKKLEEEGLIDNTIIVFSSDNGGLELKANKKGRLPKTNYPYRTGKGNFYEGGVRVPMIVKWTDKVQKAESNVPAMTIDFMPTLLSLTSTKYKKKTIDGADLSKVLKEKKTMDRTLFWHYPHYHIQGAEPYSAVLKDNWKYYKIYGKRSELYDLSKDVGEANNVIEDNQKVAIEMEKALQQWLKQTDAQLPEINPYFDPEKEKKTKPYRLKDQFWQ
ncbi:sulfatase [Flammeovirga aprica]|uniref:Sulfatase n=1 Tax=Flammeovirga aprica JL-4 TaxID=694437 RepID=A0A7X9XD80_9BACT|nr:sulfatase [Flammeovirga aprica]NME72520.1 sulfatase [Flammeovirga aprica JL-4]